MDDPSPRATRPTIVFERPKYCGAAMLRFPMTNLICMNAMACFAAVLNGIAGRRLLQRRGGAHMARWSILEIVVSQPNQELINLTADIVSAHVSNNKVASTEVAGLIQSTYEALAKAGAPAPEPEPAQEPAVPIRSSVKADYIVCLEDGKKLKMLKRYLRTNYDMTPEDYRAKWKLPRDYPMVAPAYADQRRDLAKTIGLGRKPAVAVKAVAKGINAGLEAARAHLDGEPSAKPAAKRGRPAKADAQKTDNV